MLRKLNKFYRGPVFNRPADGGAPGAASSTAAPAGQPAAASQATTTEPSSAPTAAELAAEIEKLRLELKKLLPSGSPQPDDDLGDRARRAREAANNDAAKTKRLEAAIAFDMRSKEFLKTHESLLPKDVADIFRQAEKETYSDAIEKDAAIKAGIIQSFFAVQSNMDLLTPGLKADLDDYLKLTKSGKQEKAQRIYDSIFEPAFEMLKRTKKAEALSKGYGGGSDSEAAYKQRMINLSRRQYLGEKNGS
jgi:hypothetical protein